MIPRLFILGLAAWLAAVTGGAGQTETPAPAMTPREVVEAQLEALRNNDTPDPDAGIARVWALAHPANRAITGPLDRFARMIRSEGYRILINHRAHELRVLSQSAERAAYLVTVTGATGAGAGFVWVVIPVASGVDEGAWRTISVSTAVFSGRDA